MPIEVASAPSVAEPSSFSRRIDGKDRPDRWLVPALVALVVSGIGWTLAYLALTVPGSWLSSAPLQRFSAGQMTITHGSGFYDGKAFIVKATDPSGLAIVTIDTPTVHAKDYRRIRWKVLSVDPEVTIAALWRSDAAPGKVNSAPLLPYGTDVVLALPQPPDWAGRIEGVALIVKGTLRQPMFIEEARVEPIDMRSIISDRLNDWFSYTYWSGLSINAAVGGPLEQPVWLTLVIALVGLTAVGLCFAWGRRRLSAKALSIAIAAVVAGSWVTLDMRWLWSRLEQTRATAEIYAGKSVREKHLVDIDGYVYAFAEQVIRRLPSTPARVFVGADDHYFGGRLAYHLYPHNAYMNHDTGALPPVERCKPGDFIVVFRRKGVVYDPVNRMLSWDQQRAVPADILIAHQGSAAFRLR